MRKLRKSKKFSEAEQPVVTPNTDEIANDIDAIQESVDELKDAAVTTAFAKFSEGAEAVCEECTKENLENVKDLAEQLTEKVQALEETAKFSVKRKAKFCGDKIRAFAETVEDALAEINAQEAKAEVVDESPADVQSSETVDVPPTTAAFAEDAQELEQANEELTEALEESDDPTVAMFGRKLLKVTRKAFSRRDARAKIALAKMFSEVVDADSNTEVTVDESPEVDALVDEIKDKEDKVADEAIVAFSKALRRIMKNTKSFTKGDLKAKVKVLKAFSEALEGMDEVSKEGTPAPEAPEAPAEEEKKEFSDKETPAEEPAVEVKVDEEEEVLPETIANFSSKEKSSYGSLIKALAR